MVKSGGKKPRGKPTSKARRHRIVDFLARNWATLATFAVIYVFILQFFGTYMLTKTTVTGGDLGSHWVLAQYLRDNLLPTGRVIGWYPHWMGGLPLFQYYFVPPYLLMVLLGPLISLEVAFKLVSAAWIFFTPIAFYYGAKWLGFEKPGPEIAASMSLALTWLETVTGGNYAQWGGNVKSAMAGQFPYGISLAFFAMCVGLLWKAYHSKKHLVLGAVVFSMVVLHHLYTTIALGLVSTYFIWHALRNRKFDGILHLAKIFTLGFMIAGFWLIPSYAKLDWSSPPRDVFYGLPSMDWVFIQEYTLFYLIIIFGFSLGLIKLFREKHGLTNALFMYAVDLAIVVSMVYIVNESFFRHNSYSFYFAVTALLLTLQYAVFNKEGKLMYCVYAFFLIFLQLYISQVTNLLYARFIPLIFVFYLLLTTRALINITGFLKSKSLVALIVTLLLVLWVGVGLDDVPYIGPVFKDSWYVSHGVRDARGWLKWNYEGLQVKSSWSGVKQLYNYTSNLPLKGRLNYEYYDYGKLGTARIFEQSPAFTNRSVMESLLVESSTTFPFFYYMQKTVSETSWWPGFPIKIPTVINLKHGKDIFWVYNVQYYLVYSQTIKDLIKNESDFHYLTTVGDPASGYFEIYSVNEDSHYADVPSREPILVVTDYWRPFSFKWFDVTDLDVPVAYKSDVDEYDLEHFRIIVLNKTVDFEPKSDTVIYTSDQFLDAVNASMSVNSNCGVSDDYQGELLTLNYSCLGKPLWVKIPYYPNWKTYDAERIYFASPSLMLVFPEKEHFTLYYSWLPSDILGYLVTIIALIYIAYSLLLSNHFFREKVHKRLLNVATAIPGLNKLLKAQSKLEPWCILVIGTAVSGVAKNKWKIILVLALLCVGSFALNYHERVSLCEASCNSRGHAYYSVPAFGNVVDNYDMGYGNERQNFLRDLKCTAVCDPSRREYVYVSGGGYVEYTMYVKPNAKNILSIRAIDNQNCRQNDVYMDGQYIGQIFGIGEVGQRTNFDLPLPETGKSVVKIRLYHNMSKTECYGFDVFSTQVRIPECVCLTAPSGTQQNQQLLINLLGLLAILLAVVVVLYSLSALNETLKAAVHDKIQKIIKKSRLYKMQVKIRVYVSSKLRCKKIIVLIVVALIGLYFGFQHASYYLQSQSMCSMECQAKGFEGGYAPSKVVVDDFKLGADYSFGYEEHNFVCTAVCDEQRKNYVYASGGKYIEFDMAVEPDTENTLIIKAGNFNQLCRQNDVYTDGLYVGEIKQPANALPEGDYELKLPKTSASKVRVRIDHDTSRTECWGHDIFEIKTQLPKCICST